MQCAVNHVPRGGRNSSPYFLPISITRRMSCFCFGFNAPIASKNPSSRRDDTGEPVGRPAEVTISTRHLARRFSRARLQPNKARTKERRRGGGPIDAQRTKLDQIVSRQNRAGQ